MAPIEARTVAVAVVVCVGLGLGLGLGGGEATAQSAGPAVDVTVDGTPLERGDVHHTATDPWVTVSASAPEGESIRLVEIRVDGETRHAFEPSGERVERNVALDMENGQRRVTVVAKGGGVTTHTVTIVRDDLAPTVTFEGDLSGGPTMYRTETLDRPEMQAPILIVDGEPATSLQDVPEMTVSNSTLTVAGTIDDDSTIQYVRIEHAYEYTGVGGRSSDDDETFEYDPVSTAPIHSDVPIPTDGVDGDADPERLESHLLPSPGESFNETLTLALGTNYLRIAVEDALGNLAVAHVTVTVDDGTPPTVNVTDVQYVSPTRLRIEGTATDAVQVHDVWVRETLLAADDIETDTDIETFDGRDLCSVAAVLDLDDENLCVQYDDATVYVIDETLVVHHRLVYRRPTEPDADRKRIGFNRTVYHPQGSDRLVVGANDTALNEYTRTDPLSRFLAPNVTIDDPRTGYVDGTSVAVGGRVTGGQVDDVSVEAVDPGSGRIVDIRPVELGENGTYGARLDGTADETLLRVRARDASGEEYLASTTVSEPAPTPATPSNGDRTPTTEPTGTAAPAATDDEGASVRVPFVGRVSLPSVGVPAPLDSTLSVPVPLLGPVDVPLFGVGLVALLGAGVGVRRRYRDG